MSALHKTNEESFFKYNRYILVRYSIAFFFFANLYWGIALLAGGSSFFAVLPIGLILFGSTAVYEQVKLFHHLNQKSEQQLKRSKLYYQVQLGTNLVLGLITLNDYFYSRFFYFLTDTTEAWLFLIVLLLLGSAISLGNLRHINKIQHNMDKFYTLNKEKFNEGSDK